MDSEQSNIILTELPRDNWKVFPKNKFYIKKASKIYRVKDKLWVLSSKCISVFTTDGNHVEDINHGNIKKIRSACVLSNDVIVASDSGLFALDKDGKFLYLMTKGKFNDVCYYGDSLYALKWAKNKVITFTIDEDGKWKAKQAILLVLHDYMDYMDNIDTMVVNEENICIGSYSRDSVFVFEHSGEVIVDYLMSTISNVQSGKYGSFVSCTDARGNVLVTNMSYHRLQVLTPDGNIEFIKLTGVSYPEDVCIWDENTMWFVCELGIRLVKCELLK